MAVVDDGVDPDHEDLRDNVNENMSHDYLGEDQLVRPHETHGTRVAGIIAARDNSLGMRGVAPGATIYSYNFLAEGATLENAVDALTRNMESTAVSNNSWGGGTHTGTCPGPPSTTWRWRPAWPGGTAARGFLCIFGGQRGRVMGLLQPR